MADNALLASLLMGQKRKADPLEGRRKYGENLIIQGSSTAPVQSPLEGLARALQAGVGGYFAGAAEREQEAKSTKTGELLGRMMGAKSPQEIADIAREGGGDPEILNPLLGQMIAGNMDRQQKNAVATNAYTAAGGVVPGASGGGIPQPGYTPMPGNVHQNTLGALESNNNPKAVNPQSGAAGQFQFMPQTWAEVRKNNPDLNLPDNPTQAPPELQAAAEERFRAQNAQGLKAAGIEPTPANLYLAHRAGVQGAVTILNASPDSPLSVVVPPEWIAQNPDMRTTVGDFVQNAQKRFPNGSQGGQPLTINMTPQGSADAGAPPPASPGLPGAPAAPRAPQVAQISPAAAELSRQAQAAFQAGDPARAAELQRKAQEVQATYTGEIDKERRAQETKSYNDAQGRAQPTRQEIEKLHTARAEAATIVSALEDFRREFENTGTFGAIKSIAGANTPVNTAYNTAALLAKGEQLFNLGVLNGPDLDIIRRTLPDPSTLKGGMTSNADMSTAVGKVIDLLQTRLAARERQLGLPVTDIRGASNEIRATMPGGSPQQPSNGPIAPGAIEDGYRFKGGNPADKNNWERVQ